MKTLGKTRVTTRIATLDDLGGLVECVEKLPDISTLPVGCVCHLMRSQPGYIANHLYKVCADEHGMKYWADITSADVNDLITDNNAKYVELLESGTGRMQMAAKWSPPAELDADVWVADILMRKDGSRPLSLNDGDELVRCKVSGEYKTNLFLSGYLRDAETKKFYYRLFHVYQSGYMQIVDLKEGTLTEFKSGLKALGITVV